jgi:hypothetical protein
MNNLERDAAQLKRLKLKLAINKRLSRWGRIYATALTYQVKCTDRELFNEVVEEMAAEGLLRKEIGPNRAVTLVRVCPEN